jgi:NCS2 family nucleobase:cation symporter-2
VPTSSRVRYQADENPPRPLAFGLGLQYTVLTIAGIVLTPAIVIRAAGLGDPFLTWAAFAALLVSGITTVVQARRFGHIGAGYILLMGTSGTLIAVCVSALIEGGPALLATLVIVSSLFQFLLAWRLSWLRRVITPIVGAPSSCS